MKSLVVLFALCVLMGLSQALLPQHGDDDPDYQAFEARLRKLAEVHQKEDRKGKPLTREELEDALDQFLPADPDMRESALGELFMDLMAEGHHKTGQGHHEKGHGYGRRHVGDRFGDDLPFAR
ncbi:hypothetical protein ACOMHN_038974 [Nucella lapillus]